MNQQNKRHSYISILACRISASSIVETLVASVIIVLVFSIASLALNNVFRATILSDKSSIENHAYKLIYLYEKEKLILPFYENYKGWEVLFILDNDELVVSAEMHIGEVTKTYNKAVIYDID